MAEKRGSRVAEATSDPVFCFLPFAIAFPWLLLAPGKHFDTKWICLLSFFTQSTSTASNFLFVLLNKICQRICDEAKNEFSAPFSPRKPPDAAAL